MTLQSFQLTLQRLSYKSVFLTHLLHCGSQRSKYCNQISMVDKMRDKKSNFDYRHDAVSNKWGWRVGTLYPLLPCVFTQYQTQKRQKRNVRPRKVLKINIQIWLESVNVKILKTLQITSVCGFVQLSLFSDWPFHQMSFKIDNGMPQDTCVRCSSHQVRNVADYK